MALFVFYSYYQNNALENQSNSENNAINKIISLYTPLNNKYIINIHISKIEIIIIYTLQIIK